MIKSSISLEPNMDKFISLYLKLGDVMDALKQFHALKDFENTIEYDKLLSSRVTRVGVKECEEMLVGVANELIIEYVTKAIPED